MAKSLRGSMIVGYFKEEKDDFADHGQVVTIDDEGVHFSIKTTPYGFVAPDAKVWFQTFQELDEEGSLVEREYLMTNGYLWTGAFPEAKKVVEEGRPQSMELDDESVKGTWVNSVNNNYEILIVNDAVFSKLCILGEDVEPCFEGAAITKPEISANFTLDDSFKNSLYTMISELKEVLQGGKQQMENVEKSVSETSVTEPATSAVTYAKEEDEKKKNDAATEDNDSKAEDTKSEGENKDAGNAPAAEDDKKKEDKYSLGSVSIDEYNALKDKYSALEKTVAELNAFKAEVEREKKNALISEFTMLSEEDKLDVVTNIDKYTLDEIESKLSVKCFRKKVNFVPSESEKIEDTVEAKINNGITTYALGGVATSNSSQTPEWIRAVEETVASHI